MKEFELRLSPSMAWIVVVMTIVLFGSTPSQAQTQSPAAVHIQTYYQQLMPTIQQAGKLSVRERDKRFTPAITAAFDLGTMTRLAVGPAWTSFSPGQQAAVRDAFARFIIADYASQVSNYLVRGGRVIDVYLNGTISDLAMRRDEFSSIITSGGADALIKRLRDRTQSLLGG
jgi:phospholipid transport system substrate-binding protein